MTIGRKIESESMGWIPDGIEIVRTDDKNTNVSKQLHAAHDSESISTYSECPTTEPSSGSERSVQVKRRRRRRQRKNKNVNEKKSDKKLEESLSHEEKSKYVAMDCEMVGVGYKGRKSAVARVTIIDWDGNIIMDEFVKPSREITDYRTFVSGITPKQLEDAKLDLESCRLKVIDILKNKILVGHALKNDLHALNITHPWSETRDTAKYEPFMKVRFDDGIFWPRKLKELVKEKVKRDIQLPGEAHSAYEDALAALDLYRFARRKWEKAMDYKIKKTKQIQEFQALNEQGQL